MMNDAAGVADGVRREVESMVKAQAERFVMDMNLVKREDYDALRELVQNQSAELRALKAEVQSPSGRPAQAVKVRHHLGCPWQSPGARGRAGGYRTARRGRDVQPGDHVSGPMEPNWAADILMDLDIPTIRGNHERNLIDNPPGKLNAVDRFAQEQMESRHRAWINDLPRPLALLDDVFLCHGTPTSDEEPWLDGWWDGRTVTTPDEATVAAKAEGLDYPVLLCGHTHVPRAVRLRDGRLIVNPGSVGLQFTAVSPDACYAIVELRDGRYFPSFHVIPYDHFAAARAGRGHGFSAMARGADHRLGTGVRAVLGRRGFPGLRPIAAGVQL